MAEPRLVTEKKSVNLSQKLGASNSAKKPSKRAAAQFNTQNPLINNKTANKARDSIANKLSTISANDGNYPKCSSTSGTPCIDSGGYEDKRAYAASGTAGWKAAGLSGNFVNNTTTEERVKFGKVSLPRVGMGITAMAATMYAPQAIPHIAKSAGASYISINSASHTATGLLADEIIINFTSSLLVQGAPVFTPAGIAGYALGDYLETSNWK